MKHDVFFASLLSLLFLPLARPLSAQSTPASADGGVHTDEALVVPVNGPNFSLNETAEHNSATGWANLLTPDLSFHAGHFTVDVLTPVYLLISANVTNANTGVTSSKLKTAHGLLGDTVATAHAGWSPGNFHDEVAASFAFPTGKSSYGLSANGMTYNVTNHAEYSVGAFTPDVEFGIGDSSNLASSAIKKAYVAKGTLANFQAGTSIDLPWSLSADVEGYEDLPIGNQTVYGTITRKGKNGKTKSTQVLEGTGAAEDNGFIGELDYPLGEHFILSATYEHSLIQDLNTESFGVTWTLRKPKRLLKGAAKP